MPYVYTFYVVTYKIHKSSLYIYLPWRGVLTRPHFQVLDLQLCHQHELQE